MVWKVTAMTGKTPGIGSEVTCISWPEPEAEPAVHIRVARSRMVRSDHQQDSLLSPRSLGFFYVSLGSKRKGEKTVHLPRTPITVKICRMFSDRSLHIFSYAAVKLFALSSLIILKHPCSDPAVAALLMPKKNCIAILELLCKEGVMVAK